MTLTHSLSLTAATALVFAVGSTQASAQTLIANCTGMIDLNIYQIDMDKPSQNVDGIGQSEVVIDEDKILLQGKFGEYRFDRKVGTLYHNDSDTGIYCTYSQS